MFLAGLAAYCGTAPCKPLHGAKDEVLCISNFVPLVAVIIPAVDFTKS